MNSCFKYLCFVCIVCATAIACAQSKFKLNVDTASVFESVWLWQVDTPARRIYIAGELHDHALSPGERVSHSLAYKAYYLSSHVLTEGLSSMPLEKKELKNRLTHTTWVALEAAIRQSVSTKLAAKKNLTIEQRNVPIDDVVNVINRMSDSTLFLTLPDMLRPLPADYIDGEFTREIGFLKKIEPNRSVTKPDKQNAIETSDASDASWVHNCGQPRDTESLINEILAETGPNAQSTELRIRKLDTEFRSNVGTTESITESIGKSLYWNTVNKCSVQPRNREWMKRILLEIDKDKKPLMVVAGIGHVVGDTGLLALLCKEGFCKSKRIQLADF